MNKIFVQKISSENGQGLMELIVAIGIIVVGLFSVWALFFSNFAGEQEAETRMVASNLAREGLEVVKNLRDSNWLSAENNIMTGGQLWTWDNGFVIAKYYALGQIFSTSSGYVGSTTLVSIDGPDDARAILYINKDGFYDHNATGNPSGFKRFLAIRNICCASTDGLKCNDETFTIDPRTCSSGQNKIGIDVISEVRWQGANKQARKVLLQDQLFNWR